MEASSLLPCFLDVHRSVSSDRHPSSVSVALHRHFVVSRRSFLGHAQRESLSSWIVTYSCTHLLKLRRTCFGGMKRNNRFTCLSSSWYFPTRFLHRLAVRGCVQMVSRGLSLSSRNRTLRSKTPVSMSVPAEVEASASNSVWVSDLEPSDGALKLANGIEFFRFGLRIWPSQANVHDSAFHDHWLIILRISVRLYLFKQFRMCTHTVSLRPGIGSSLRTHTPGPQAGSTEVEVVVQKLADRANIQQVPRVD